MRDDLEWLADIHEGITNIERYALRGRDAFLQEELIQVWMRYHFQVFPLVPKLHLGTPGGAQAQLGNE